MEICFSIASGGSTMTRRMDESFAVIPEMKSNLDVHAMKAAASRLDAMKQAENVQLPAMAPTAAKMASQLRIMDELGRVCRDSPISVVESSHNVREDEFSK